MADYTPVFLPGRVVTFTTSAQVTGGQLVALTGSFTVAPAGAGSAAVVGVANFDAAAGAKLTVTGAALHRLQSAGTIAVGSHVKSAAAGAVVAFVPGTDDPTLDLGKAITAGVNAGTVDVLVRV